MTCAHTLLFVCPDCNLPSSISRISDFKNLEQVEQMSFHIRCESCDKTFQMMGFLAKLHWVTEWDGATELITKRPTPTEPAPDDLTLDPRRAISSNGNGERFLHTLVFECPGCQLPVVIGRLSAHGNREVLSSEPQRIQCLYCKNSFRVVAATARRHYIALWKGNPIRILGASAHS